MCKVGGRVLAMVACVVQALVLGCLAEMRRVFLTGGFVGLFDCGVCAIFYSGQLNALNLLDPGSVLCPVYGRFLRNVAIVRPPDQCARQIWARETVRCV